MNPIILSGGHPHPKSAYVRPFKALDLGHPLLISQAGLEGSSLERLSKFSIPYGGIARPDKLGH